MNVNATALPTVKWKWPWIQAVLIAPPMPPTPNNNIDSATLENSGSFHGKCGSQSSSPVAPLARPATSIDAVTVNAVTKLANRIPNVSTVWNSFHEAGMPGSMNWWWKPTGVERTTNHTNTSRASGSLNSFPPATFGRIVYHTTYAGRS